MTILDFREIPTASAMVRNKRNKDVEIALSDLDAFEKFAEEFFEKIEGYKIIGRVARGTDMGADLIALHEGKRILISCKHYAESNTAVGPSNEGDLLLKMAAHNCTKFIGFYSTIPTSSWQGLVTMVAQNSAFASYEFEFFKSSDIESSILDKDNATGWLLAARYFPKSFANLFRKFVVPIEHYKIEDVIEQEGTLILDGPHGSRISGKLPTKEAVVAQANDDLTNSVHIGFFREALKEAIDCFPAFFLVSRSANLSAVRLEDLSPAWDTPLGGAAAPGAMRCNIPILVSALWSYWNPEKSLSHYLDFSGKDTLLHSPESNLKIVKAYAHLQLSQSAFLTIGSVAKFCAGPYRDIFSRLTAFSPSNLISTADEFISLAHTDGSPVSWSFEANTGLEFLQQNLR